MRLCAHSPRSPPLTRTSATRFLYCSSRSALNNESSFSASALACFRRSLLAVDDQDMGLVRVMLQLLLCWCSLRFLHPVCTTDPVCTTGAYNIRAQQTQCNHPKSLHEFPPTPFLALEIIACASCSAASSRWMPSELLGACMWSSRVARVW